MNASPAYSVLLGLADANGTVTGVTTGTSKPFRAMDYENVTAYVVGSSDVSAGAVTFEEASFNDRSDGGYTGTWSAIGSAVTVTASSQTAYHLPSPCAYHYVRARITTTIVGGTCSVALVAN